MFEPPSPAMSLYFFMRRLRRRWSPLASRRGGDWARPTHLSSLASRRGGARLAHPRGAGQHGGGHRGDERHRPGAGRARWHPAAEARHAHRLGAHERQARDVHGPDRDEHGEDPREVAPGEHPALEPPARAVEEPRDAHGEQGARAEPDQRRATHREDRELEIERGEPVHDAVPEVRPRGLSESRLTRGHGPDGRKRPPHVALTSASSSRVTTVPPRPRAYASTALTTIPRAKDGIARSRSRAASSHTSSQATGNPNVSVAGSSMTAPPWAPGW